MNIGQVYIVVGKAVMPITVPDLEGYFIQIEIPLDESSIVTDYNHPLFKGAVSFIGGKTLNVRRANEYMERTNNGIKNLSAVIANTKDKKTYVSTYVPISTTPLSIGDDFVEIANNTAYTVFGYFPKEVASKTAVGSQKTIMKLYPYGINIQPMMQFVDSVTSGKLGLSEICKDKDVKKGLADASKKSIEDLAIQNSRLPFAAANYQKPTNLLYVKQDRPPKVVQPIKMVQKKAKGKKLVNVQSVANTLTGYKNSYEGFDNTTNRLQYDFYDDQKLERFKQWQENNFISPQLPALPTTGNKLLDDFTFVTVESMAENDNLFATDNEIQFMPKNQEEVKKYNIDVIGNHNAYIDTAGNIGNFNNILYYRSYNNLLSECVKTEDYSRYAKVANFGQNYQSRAELSNGRISPYQVDNYGIIKYFGGGLFSCLQNNEQPVAGDMYGVGDIFTLTKDGSSREFVVLYMYYALDKKQNKKKICVCIVYNDLAAMETDKASEPLFHIEGDWLEANATNHKSYFEARKKIKDFYLYEGTNTTATGANSVSPYQEYKDLFGEDYDDTFLSAVSQLDWMRINEMQKAKPEIMEAVKVIVSELYLAYLKDKANRPKIEETANKDINYGKYYFDLYVNNNSTEAMNDTLGNMVKVLGDSIIDQFVYIKPEDNSVAADVDLDDVKKYMNTGIGNQEDLRLMGGESGWHRNRQTIIFQEKQEPILQVIVRSALDVGDSQLNVEVSNLLDNNDRLSKRSSKDINYYQMYVGDAIMRYLVLIDYLQKSDAIPDSKKKKIFPLVLTDYAIQRLQYMNRWGLFDTPEEMYERFIQQQSIYTGHSYFIDLSYYKKLLDIYVSHSTSIAYDKSEKRDEFFKSVSKKNNQRYVEDYFRLNKDAIINYLYSLPIDWGNKNAPYMISATATTPVATAKKRRTKQPTTPEPTTTTTKIQLNYNNPVAVYFDGMLTVGVVRRANERVYNEGFNGKLGIIQFQYQQKGGGNSNLYFFRITKPKNKLSVIDNFIADKFTLQKQEYSILTPDMGDKKYEGFKVQIDYLIESTPKDYDTIIYPMVGYDNFVKFNKETVSYFENLQNTITATPEPPTPTTNNFEWIYQWQNLFNDAFNKRYADTFLNKNQDRVVKVCQFKAGYTTPNDPPMEICILSLPFLEPNVDRTAFELWDKEIYNYLTSKYETKVNYSPLMTNYTEITAAMNEQDSGKIFVKAEDLNSAIRDIENIILNAKPAAANDFVWVTGVWLPTLEREDKEALNYKYDLGDDFNLYYTVVRIGEQEYYIFAFNEYNTPSKIDEIDTIIRNNVNVLDDDEKKKIYDSYPEQTDKLYDDLTDFKTYWVKEEDNNFAEYFKPLLDNAVQEYQSSQKPSTPTTPVEPTEPTKKTVKKTKEPKTTQTTKIPKIIKPKKGKLSPEELSQSLDDIDLDF